MGRFLVFKFKGSPPPRSLSVKQGDGSTKYQSPKYVI